MSRKLINKIFKKKTEGCCFFCNEKDYALLHVHRISFEDEVNRYTDFNTIVVCANCHCRIHDGQILIDRKYFSTNGKYVLHYWIVNGNSKEEFWK